MIVYCGKNHIDAVVVWKLDRFARNTYDHAMFQNILAKTGTEICSVTEATSDTPTGRMLATFLSGIAQWDNEVRAERCRLGMESVSKAGGWTHMAPLGYRRIKSNNTPSLEPDPVTGPIVRECFELIASGQMPVKDTPAWLGMKLARKIYTQHVHSILRNPLYIGIIKSRLTDFVSVRATFQGLVTVSTWEKVQAVLQRGMQHRSERPSDEFPMRGSLMCGSCGSMITASNSKNKLGKLYPYYHCKCGLRIGAAKVQDSFEQFLDTTTSSTVPMLKLFKRLCQKVWTEEVSLAVHDHALAAKHHQVIKKRQAKLLDLYLAGDVDEESYRNKSHELETQSGVVKTQYHDCSMDHLDANATIEIAEKLFSDLKTLFVRTPSEHRQRLVKAVFGGVLTISSDGKVSNTHKSGVTNILHSKVFEFSDVVGQNGLNKNTILEIFQEIRSISDLAQYCPARLAS